MDTRSLVKLAVGGAIVLGGLAFPPFLAGDGIVWGTMLATALASVAAGNTANAIDALTQGKDSDRISLENEDLTKAVGKAIAAVITLAAKQHPRDTRNKLEKIAAQAKDNWVKIAKQELTKERYPQLREAKLDRFLTPEEYKLTPDGKLTQDGNLTPEEYKLTQDGNLTPQEWQDIFIRLNMAACKGGGFQLPPEVYPQVADLLHTTFPKALRETLKEDFAKDGKAFAGLTLQLLTGMKAELAQLRNSNLGVNTAELSQILQHFQQLETQLRGTVAQQQAFFRQISQQIDSGFAEVCQQLGVMETNITGLLQNLEKRLDALDEKLTRLEAPRGRQLSKQEYRTRQALLSQMGTEVESRLAQSLHHAILLNLGKEQQPHQVQRPWDVSVKVGEQRSFLLPSETSILEVFENPAINGKFLILGKPGGGKTTTLLQLAQALIQRAETDSDAPIPVILELSEWRTVTKAKFPDFWNKEKYDPSIKEWILSQLRSKGVSQEIGEQWIKEKELVLFLDGLDELPSERQAKCVRAINQFLDSEFSPLHLVVCSRKEEYENYEEVLHLNGAICLEDLTVEQMRYYFASVNLGEFWESIKDSEKIVNFIRQPLFLAITSIAYQQIDVEEWRNCNTQKKSIDYLLGIYRVEMLTRKKASKWYRKNQPIAVGTQNTLIKISRYLSNDKITELRVDNLQPSFLYPKLDSFYNILSFIFLTSFCIIIAAYSGFMKLKLDEFPLIINWLSFFAIFDVIVLRITQLICKLSDVFAWFLNKLNKQEKFKNLFPIINIVSILHFLLFILGYYIYPLFMFFLVFPNFYSIWENFNIPLIKGILSGLAISILFTDWGDWGNKEKTKTIQPVKKIFSVTDINMALTAQTWFTGIIISLSFFRNLDTFFVTISIFMGLGIVLGIVERENKEDVPKVNIILNSFFYSILFFGLGMFFGIIPSLKFRIDIALSNGIILGLLFSLFAGFACIQYLALRLTLWLTGQMPWNITRFLDYCTERLILQRVGNRYRFIHRLVQEHFANLEIQKE